MKIHALIAVTSLLLHSMLPMSYGEGTLHTFTSPDGRTLKAVITIYNPGNGKIQIKRENGKNAWVHPTAFSEEDQEYIRKWITADRFMSTAAFKIKCDSIEESKTAYADKSRTGGARIKSSETTDIVYTITLHNRTGFPLKNVKIEYRAFITTQGYAGREDRSRVDGGSLVIDVVPDGERTTAETDTIELRTSYITQREYDIYSTHTTYSAIKTHEDNLKGFWVRVYGPVVDGKQVFRDWCYPSDTMEKYGWQELSSSGRR